MSEKRIVYIQIELGYSSTLALPIATVKFGCCCRRLKRVTIKDVICFGGLNGRVGNTFRLTPLDVKAVSSSCADFSV